MAMSRSFGATALTSRSSMKICPEVTVSSPAIIASKVDLPQPEGPTRAMNSPSRASMSMPFRTSTGPNRLCTPLIVSVAMRLLDRSQSETADKILAAEEIDQQRRQRRDQHGAAHDVELRRLLAGGPHRDQRSRDRLRASGREHHAEQILVPDPGELPDHGDDQDRRRQRQDDAMEDAPEAG